MSLITAIRTAIADKSGAVTVDWVVLTAAVVVLSIGAISALDGGIETMITSINAQLSFSNVASQAAGS
jgi:Flp pilus assembly pilin Flp